MITAQITAAAEVQAMIQPAAWDAPRRVRPGSCAYRPASSHAAGRHPFVCEPFEHALRVRIEEQHRADHDAERAARDQNPLCVPRRWRRRARNAVWRTPRRRRSRRAPQKGRKPRRARRGQSLRRASDDAGASPVQYRWHLDRLEDVARGHPAVQRVEVPTIFELEAMSPSPTARPDMATTRNNTIKNWTSSCHVKLLYEPMFPPILNRLAADPRAPDRAVSGKLRQSSRACRTASTPRAPAIRTPIGGRARAER